MEATPGVPATLARSQLFSGLAHEACELLAVHMVQRRCAAGEPIFQRGEPGTFMCVIAQGRVRIQLTAPDGQPLTIRLLGPGESFGEAALLDGGNRTADAVADDECWLLLLDTASFRHFLDAYPVFSVRLLAVFSDRMRQDTQAYDRLAAELRASYANLQQNIREHERVEQELQVARRIQLSLLPSGSPAVRGWHLTAHYAPARQVGGDFYDYFDMPAGGLALVIGDAAGKGIPAALLMATTRSTVRAAARHAGSPGQVLGAVNDLLCRDMPASMFVTCLFAVLDPSTGRVQFANAGHLLPLVRTSSGGVTEPRARGVPLGLMEGTTYEENGIDLGPGDELLLHSDGVAEAHNAERQMFGLPRLTAVVRGHRGSGLISAVLHALRDFSGEDWEQEDDITLLTLSRDVAHG
jgi:serine phosphatase RsbU (regulator of sigma subunit)